MKTTSLDTICQLQQKPKNIRNMCILAHVDHGKTTLADTLLASNGIISHRMAGKLRYLDSREDEQLRGITMKSSAISLHFIKNESDYLINLIDSPGHIDFSSEVSTAVRLCDGAIVLVDVVEGVCPQTHAVLRQAWLEHIKPVLMLNKVDRLITELKMTPLEAHLHLRDLLEQVNAITGALFSSDVMSKANPGTTDDSKAAETDKEQVYDWSTGLDDADDELLYFSPEQGNVIFGSAYDGWGFSTEQFAHMWSKKLGMNATVLLKTLWGDFYLENKTKRIKKGAQAKGKKPLFVQFILENLWAVYESVLISRDPLKVEKIVKSLNLKISARDSRHTDGRIHLRSICSQWLPLSQAVLSMVVEKLPSPLDMSVERVEKLLCPVSRRFDSLPQATQNLKNDFLKCSGGEDAPTIVYVSKMFTIDRSALPNNRRGPLTVEEIAKRREVARKRHAERLAKAEKGETEEQKPIEEEKPTVISESPAIIEKEEEDPTGQVFLAFARVFSGCVKRKQKIYILGPKHDPASYTESGDMNVDDKHVLEADIEDLFLYMGRELEPLMSVPAGNILGIGGLEGLVLKSATISDTLVCPAFTDMYIDAAPIVRVAVEPKHLSDMGRLAEGLKLLNQADPCVQTFVQENGEHIILTAGEVHLEKCLDDLKNRFARIELHHSAPNVPFRETIVLPPTFDMVNEAIQDQNPAASTSKPEEDDEEILSTGVVQMRTANNLCTIVVEALPLPLKITNLLEANEENIRTLNHLSKTFSLEKTDSVSTSITDKSRDDLCEFRKVLGEAFDEAGGAWTGAAEQIIAFGPKRVGPNVLVNRVPGYCRLSVWHSLDNKPLALRDLDSSIVSGFQMATLAGPLCEEPLMGVCYSLNTWTIDDSLIRKRGVSECETPATDTIVENPLSAATCSTNQAVASESAESSNSSYKEADAQVDCDSSDTVLADTDAEGSKKVTKKDPLSYGPFSGQLMSCMKDACRKAFQSQPQRLMAAMYTCDIQVPADVLGKMYGVMGKRHGQILDEDMQEGSDIFKVTAVLPVIESFGFSEEIRKRTSGLASPQLKFSHWEVIDIDPFWVPTTEEEYLQFGEKADSDNLARIYMNNVRKRKGLRTDEKIVEFAEKQRTLTRNK